MAVARWHSLRPDRILTFAHLKYEKVGNGRDGKVLEEDVCANEATGCVLWAASQTPNGYGKFYLRGAVMGAHRASYILSRGEIPAGMSVCHKCDTPLCVNPDHLFLGTQKDNSADMIAKGRQVIAPHDGANNPMYGRAHSEATKARISSAARGRFTGDEHPRATVTNEQAREIRALRGVETARSIAARLGVTPHVANNIWSGKSWRNVQ